VDVRVIVATNKDLAQEIAAGRFREDLFYRLNVFPLHVPALKERREDIPVLIQEFTQAFCQENGFRPLDFADEVYAILKAYPWPGNVRELKNFIERMLIMYAGQKITADDLPPEFRGRPRQAEPLSTNDSDDDMDFKNARAEFERRFLLQKFNECEGNVSRLAETVGLERSYLHRKLRSYGIH
jgi:two-component system nitrogen regulation response regulator NtrX